MGGLWVLPPMLERDSLTLPGALGSRASRDPDAIAVLAPGRTPLTHRGLSQQIAALGETLGAVGVGRRDRIALALPPGPEAAVALIAVASVTTCAPLDPGRRAAEYERLLSDMRATALMVQADADGPARAVAQARGLPVIELSLIPEAPAGLVRLTAAEIGRPVRPASAGPGDVALLLPTSGTTGRPKLVSLTHANLCASAANIGAALDLSARDRCLDVMPLFHIHGFMAALASLVAGGSVACPPTFDVLRFFAWLQECRPTWYTAVPAMHNAILGQAPLNRDVIASVPLRFVRSASAPLPARVAAELERVFSTCAIEAYGMTEAAHQITSTPLPPRARKAGSVGVAAGPDVAIVDEAGCPLPANATGEIAIRGANVTQEPTNERLPNASPVGDGWLRTGDQGYLDADGYLFITGRLKDVINRGGEKVSPREVDDVLLEHPAVAEAVAFGVAHPTLGEDVAAAVVLRPGATVSSDALRAFAAARLAEFKVPGRMHVVDRLPRGSTGKLARRAVAEALSIPEPGGAAPFTEPRTPVEAALVAIWTEVLGHDGMGIHDDFFALGGDSILAALVVARVLSRLGVELRLGSVFEAPTVAGLAERVARAHPAHSPEPLASPTAAGASGAPLSFTQEGLWFLDQLMPGNIAYNRPAAFRLTGSLDVEALARSLQEVVTRHEALRMTFRAVDGRPAHVVTPELAVSLPVIDLSSLPSADRRAEGARVIAEEARRPFDLARGLLFRAILVRLGEDSHLLLLTLHHIVTDAWSIEVISRELATLYPAFAAGQPSPLPELPIQFPAWARRQRESITGDALARQLEYWKRHLRGTLPILELPTDRPRPPRLTFQGATAAFALPLALTDALKALSRAAEATLFMTLLAAFNVLLSRYTRQEDILVGTMMTSRGHVAAETLVGCFVNALALRTDLSGDPAFLELLARVREAALGAYAHQDLPFEQVVAALNPARDPSHAPLFQVMFVFENIPRARLTLPGLCVEPLPVDTGTAKFDLTLSMEETPGGLRGVLEYSTDLFDAARITRMLGHFQTLLEGVVTDPRRRLSALPLLAPAERRQLLVSWNATTTEYPREACLQDLVEAQVARAPEAIAVVFGEGRLTYDELNRRANRLAHGLRRHGLGRGTRVGVCMDRSPEMIVALLGVLKAGGAYVPLDPGYPEERLAFMLDDAGVALVLTRERFLPQLRRDTGRALCLDRDWSLLESEDETNPPRLTDPDDLAYVVYTSGSTGRPKGILIAHRGVVNNLAFVADTYRLAPPDVTLQLASISFDASVRDLFTPLTVGARLALVRHHELSDPPALVAAIRRHRVTAVLAIVPYLLRGLIAAAQGCEDAMASLRLVLVSGEPLQLGDVAWLRRLLPRDAMIVNQYGPSEGTMISSYHPITDADGDRGVAPIGRPIPNVRLYVLDDALNPVPVGVPGELHIGGIGLGRGYLNRAELTAARFIPDPFADEPGPRLYKSGDLVRYRPDGSLEFLGRLDHQVKIRGVRVELGEIEAVLGRHPEVREAVAVLRQDMPGEPRLVAYVVPRSDHATATEGTLRAFLKRELPEVMVPACVVMLDRLPVTPNLKVDRRALPAPMRPELDSPFTAPRTPVEEMLAGIWAETLGLETVGIHDDFFGLGGHSLLATRLLARVCEASGVELPLGAFLETPTVAGLAGALAWRVAEPDGRGEPDRPVEAPCAENAPRVVTDLPR